ncbi:hypothetical protein NIASO_04525 [Niabella soli DSM 19437]|uniref:Uncharacterized protein n=1 Tax=Niabella soli DSM 19437 TaxID=929713 RepID=W0F7C0_9BACT|nr:hypothetical protein NIASO_04525 [Niabella soli DSM 19437]
MDIVKKKGREFLNNGFVFPQMQFVLETGVFLLKPVADDNCAGLVLFC